MTINGHFCGEQLVNRDKIGNYETTISCATRWGFISKKQKIYGNEQSSLPSFNLFVDIISTWYMISRYWFSLSELQSLCYLQPPTHRPLKTARCLIALEQSCAWKLDKNKKLYSLKIKAKFAFCFFEESYGFL